MFNSITMGGTSVAGTAYPSGAPEFILVLWGSCYSIFSFLCCVLWIIVCVFVLLLSAIYCLSFDLRFLTTLLVSSNFSENKIECDTSSIQRYEKSH